MKVRLSPGFGHHPVWSRIRDRHRLLRARPDTGFTLIELLVTIVVLPLIVGAISVALIAVFSQQTSVSTRVDGSGDAQVTSAEYVSDIQGAASFTADRTTSTSPSQCGNTGSLVFALDWTDSAGTITVVSYRDVSQGAGKPNSLFRLACQGGSVVDSTAVSHDVPSNLGVGTGLSGLTVTCATTSNAAPQCVNQSYLNGWIPTAGILSVTLTTAELTKSNYTYTLSATPRALTPQSTGLPPGGNLPLLLLNSSGLGCNGNNVGSGVTVTGTVATNSTSDGAINLHSGSQLAPPAGFSDSIYTADQSGSVYSGAAAAGPPAITTGPPIPDPYLGTPVPTSTPVYPPNTPLGNPGEYTGSVSVAGNSPFTIPSGIYIFDQGLSLTGQAVVSSQSGGVLFYIAGGQISDTGQGGFNLTPIQTAPYTGLVLWQASTDSNPLFLAGNGTGSTFTGAIYAPGAVVGGQGNGALSAGSIVSNGLSCGGGGSFVINQQSAG